MSTTDVAKIQLSLAWAWTGPAAAIACMIVLFIAGIVTQTPGLTVMATSIAGAMGGLWVALYASLRRSLTRAQHAA